MVMGLVGMGLRLAIHREIPQTTMYRSTSVYSTDGDGFGWNGIATCDPSAR